MEAGKTQTYAPGVPNFDMEIIPTRRNNQSGADLYLNIPYESFTFEKDSTGFSSPYEFQVEIRRAENKQVAVTRSWVDTLHISNRDVIEQSDPISASRRFNLSPGEYVFRVVLQDLNNDKQAIRSLNLEVPDFGSDEPRLTQPYLKARTSEQSFEPVVNLHIPADVDSLTTVAELYNVENADHIEVVSHLLRFRSDHSVAKAPDGITPMTGSLEYQGTEYDKIDTVQTQRYTLENPADSLQITFSQPSVEPGMYRITLEVQPFGLGESSNPPTLHQQRTLSVKSPGFPEINSLDEMIEALAYITRGDELEEIRAQPTQKERRRAFDAFWGKIAENKQEASDLIETYYGRVREANRFFTSHKEGWKTDRGMIYVVYGAPIRVERYVNQEIWYYGYSSRNPRDRFVFTRGQRYSRNGPLFNNFLLERRPYYRRDWDRAVSRWRDGQVPHGV
jgi:GWxTD domain-containing protein